MTTSANPAPHSNHPNFTREDLTVDTILTNHDGINCRIDKIEHDQVYLSVMDGKTIHGKTELQASMAVLLDGQWNLFRKAA